MNSMIRNGLYHITVEMLDGIQGGNQGVMVLRDGTMRGGDSFFYAFGTYIGERQMEGRSDQPGAFADIWGAADLGTQSGDNRIYRNLYR